MRWSQQANRNSIQNPYEIAANTSVSHDFILRHPPHPLRKLYLRRGILHLAVPSLSHRNIT